jgi:predicted enzyme related to lactoylglutathione lyase
MIDYAPGVPMWVDVSSSDMDKTRAFYTGLFGWEAQVVPDPQAGGYTMFLKDGKSVGAAGPIMDPGQPAVWATYVKTEDADATAQAVTDAGGQVVFGPMDVMGQGRMAVLSDPTGAFVSIWQPQAHTGAELVNEPGSFCWNELYTRDVSAAREFYRKVFGWGIKASEFDGGEYTEFQVDGRSIAGGLDMRTMLDDSIPPHWLVYFTIRNTAETVDRVKELGGTVMNGPFDTPMGKMAVLQDPVGAVFAVIEAGSHS